MAQHPSLHACTAVPREIRAEEKQPQPSDGVSVQLCELSEMLKYLLLLQDDGSPGLLNSPFFTWFRAFCAADFMPALLTDFVFEEGMLLY